MITSLILYPATLIHAANTHLTKIPNRIWSKDESIHIVGHFQEFLW